MALSNIFREPRREITETLIGMTLFGGFLILDHLFANWFYAYMVSNPSDCPLAVCYFVLPFGLLVTSVILYVMAKLIHWVGEEVCDWLDDYGFDPRPKRRY